MNRHAANWTGKRRMTDRLMGRTYPGKHHPIWPSTQVWISTPGGGLLNQAAFDHMAHEMFGASK